MSLSKSFDIWKAKVRRYEVDFQGIVHNAHYMYYMDEARVALLAKKGFDLHQFSKEGIDIVVVSSHIQYKASLRVNDQFMVRSTWQFMGKIRLIIKQEIWQQNTDKPVLCISPENTICALKTGKPIYLPAFEIFR